MFEIKECFDEALCRKYSKKFGADYQNGDRAFVFYEDGVRGLGVLGLTGGTVLLKTVTDCGSAENHQYMLHAVLAVLSRMNPIRVLKKGVEPSLERFGFAEKDGNMEILTSRIRLGCH